MQSSSNPVEARATYFDCWNSEDIFNGRQYRSRDPSPTPSSRLQAATVGSRSDPNDFMKEAAHVGMARKAAIESDVDERHRWVLQQFPSSFELQIEQVVVWTVACSRLEHTDEMD